MTCTYIARITTEFLLNNAYIHILAKYVHTVHCLDVLHGLQHVQASNSKHTSNTYCSYCTIKSLHPSCTWQNFPDMYVHTCILLYRMNTPTHKYMHQYMHTFGHAWDMQADWHSICISHVGFLSVPESSAAPRGQVTGHGPAASVDVETGSDFVLVDGYDKNQPGRTWTDNPGVTLFNTSH